MLVEDDEQLLDSFAAASPLATQAKCFEWNRQMWEGVPRSKNPAFTVCGLDKCVPCKKNNSKIVNGTSNMTNHVNGTKNLPNHTNGTSNST